jgi:hypothetical protein
MSAGLNRRPWADEAGTARLDGLVTAMLHALQLMVSPQRGLGQNTIVQPGCLACSLVYATP